MGQTSFVLSKIKSDFSKYVSYTFEDVVRQSLHGICPFQVQPVGSWWERDKEIDLVGLNNETNEIIFGECKWQNRPVTQSMLNNLIEKSKSVMWKNNKRKEYFLLAGKSGFDKEITHNK